MAATAAPGGFRSLADQLRSWSDERLAQLLLARPDLATPAPHDFGHLASRAGVRASVLRALDDLDRLELTVLDALVVLGQTSRADLLTAVNAAPPAVETAVDRLLGLALVQEPPGAVRPVGAVVQVLGAGDAGVSGLYPRAEPPLRPDEVEDRLAELSPQARALLEHVADRGGRGATAVRPGRLGGQPAAPVEELLQRRLLVPREEGVVHVPGEVGLVLRGGCTTAERVDVVPELLTDACDQVLVDRTAAGAAFEAVRRVELLLDHWSASPPVVLRSGGLGVRELRAAARQLHADQPTAALVVEAAAEAGLLGQRADPAGVPVWVPTDAFDTWLDRGPAGRWVVLARAWLDSARLPGLVGSRDAAGKAWNALDPELTGRTAAETRRMALAELAALPPGYALAPGTGLPSLVARLQWLRPRRPPGRDDQVAWAVAEAAVLGVTGLGGLAGHGRALIAGDDPAATLTPLLPEPVDHLLVQADLTAVAPGPLESSLARRLQLLADVESRGGATVYRFTPASVRRTLAAGWTAAEIHEFLASVSRTPLPQPLGYLVDDVARTFGAIRVGAVEAFLRADDEAALTELLRHPPATALGLRRIAPTVLVSSTPVDVLLPRLRELGTAPVLEGPDGMLRVGRPEPLRARTPRQRRTAVRQARAAASVTAVVAAIRSGDRAAAARGGTGASLTPGGSLAALREAVAVGGTVLIGYVDQQGTVTDRVVDPISLAGGRLTAHDHRVGEVRDFAVHRIRVVRPLDDADRARPRP